MEFFSDCSGPCETCHSHFTGGCLTGHEDDCYYRITKKNAKVLIDKGYVEESLLPSLYSLFPDLKDVKEKEND